MSTKKRKADNNDAVAAAEESGTTSVVVPSHHQHTDIMEAAKAGNHDKVLSLLQDAAAADDDDDDVKQGGSINNEKSNINTNTNTTTTTLSQQQLLASYQDPKTGTSPLMISSKYGHIQTCQTLLNAGAPWNAIDRYGKCAGDYATDAQQWHVVNLLVEAGTKAELILGASIRLSKQIELSNNYKTDVGAVAVAANHHNGNKKQQDSLLLKTAETEEESTKVTIPISHEPCTKPDYLEHDNVRYNAANTLLLDNDNDAVMMEWERPLMNAHASILTNNGTKHKRVLNIGFGLGIIDTALQSYEPSLHVIIEAHPTVYQKMITDGWGKDKKSNVRICFGRWQDELPKLINEGLEFDGIFYDTYGEHFTDLEDFHELMAKVLHKPDGVYSFFNGLAPDNLFFHGVACNCVKIQLSHLGLETEFAQCEIQVNEKEWEGVRRKYWHRDTYYLPIATWKKKDVSNEDKD